MDYLQLIRKRILQIFNMNFFSFSAGEIVIEYVGELITNKIADYREKEYNQRGFGDCYMFRLDQDYIVINLKK